MYSAQEIRDGHPTLYGLNILWTRQLRYQQNLLVPPNVCFACTKLPRGAKGSVDRTTLLVRESAQPPGDRRSSSSSALTTIRWLGICVCGIR